MDKFTAQDWTVFFTGVVTVIGALAAATVKILAAIKEVHLSVNSRMDQLLAESRKASLAEGRDSQRQAQANSIAAGEDLSLP